jgi:hypothetical protein
MRTWFAIACLALAPLATAADAPADSAALYSHALPVTFQGSGGMVQLRLPKDVYLQARSPTLDDLRLFDSHGRKVPFALTMPLTQRGVSHRVTPTKVFALDAGLESGAATLAIRTRADGTLLSVDSSSVKPVPAQALAGLLIDLALPDPGHAMVNALVFTAPPGVANYSARVALEASDDLQAWRPVAQAQLDWLDNGAHDKLANNRIAFNARAMRYMRLRWREGQPRMFGAIAVEREVVDAVAYAPDTLLVAAQDGVFPGDLVYPVGRALPLRTIGMQLAETGVVIPSEIGHYIEVPALRAGAGRWQFVPLLRTTFYRIAQDGAVHTPPDLVVAPMAVDRLVVRPLTPVAVKPAIRIGWLPATLIFAAREAGPYTLAVGRDQAMAAVSALSDIAPGYREAELLTITVASAGPAVVQHPVAQQAGTAEGARQSATARTLALWGALLLGVLVLAVLSWKMVRQQRGDDL